MVNRQKQIGPRLETERGPMTEEKKGSGAYFFFSFFSVFFSAFMSLWSPFISSANATPVTLTRNIAIIPLERLVAYRDNLPALVDRDRPKGTLRDALKGADVFIGLARANLLTPGDLDLMAPDRIVFAMANPDPEIKPELAVGHCRIFATGRSDYPNQINNALAFPGIFRGALDAQAREINDAMKMAAARAIAGIIPDDTLSEDYIIPSLFDKQVVPQVAQAVAQAARETGVARNG